ncbi:hypothetical protein BBJ28_00009049 [Nothophytophthora sp. Chile5]|nr:hypothetical protein BBJ28_00009049 [Nothophytophthora sp. Chile5]
MCGICLVDSSYFCAELLTKRLCCKRVNSYSEAKAQFMGAKAREFSGEFDKALNAYRSVMKSGDSSLGVQAALAIAELLAARKQPQDALEALDAFPVSGVEDEVMAAVLSCTRGWLLYEQGDLEGAQALLETNVSKIPTTDATTKGRSLKRLAIVYWHLGGSYQQDKTRCFNHLLQAAKLTPSDAQIFAWLGKWYQDVAKDILRAEKCFLKALSLSSIDELAGMALSDLYIQQGKHELNVKLWERVTEDQETAPTWALLRLAQHLVNQNDELAVGKMHLVLRNEPLNARHWVILAHIYRNFDKQVSAQKSYLKAIELGEESWCVRCELARIEGSLRLFDDALERIEPIVLGELPASSSVSEDSPDVTVASMLYADLLFQQAKYLCAEGLYGHAAANLKQSSRIMKGLPSASMLSGSVEACKLIGDIHCFAFYLSPEDFSSSEGATWVDFIGEGRKAYEAAVLLAGKTSKTTIHDAGTTAATADMYYDVGLSYWYEVQAVASVRGLQLPAFSPQSGPIDNEDDAILFKLKTKAGANFRLALQADPACAAAWNGLALVADKLLVKQFCWARAVQTGSSSDATWANLGMFYLDQADAVSAATSLAQKSFLQLQSMNADNPSMWNGYAMLARRQAGTGTDSSSIKQQKKAIEAFDCALQVGLDLDALLGLSMALLDYEESVGKAVTQAAEHRSEQVMFYLKKYLERDPFNARAWHALGVTQHRLGLHAEALASYARAASPLQATASELGQRGLEWNTLVTEVGALSSTPRNADSNDSALLQMLTKLMNAMKDTSSVLYNVVQAQLLYRQSKGDAALDLLKKLLLREDLQPNESEDVAMVRLSIASLLMGECTSRATDIAAVCKDRLLSSTTLAESASANSDNALILRLIELHERLVSAEDACLSRLQIAVQTSDDSSSSMAWTRLALATIDSESLQVSSCLSDYLRSGAQARDATPSGDDAVDRSFLDALVGLFKAGPSGTTPRLPVDALKLIRMQPWNPHAYVLAGASILKRISLEASDESHVQLLRQLARLLQTGLSFADAKNGDEYNAAQLELLTGYCYVKLGEQEQAEACAERGFTWVQMGKESGALVSSVDAELLESRLLSISSPAKAIARYLSIIATVSDAASPSACRLVPILNELGGLYEEQELSNAAIQVWKLVASLTSSKTVGSFELDDDSSSTTTALSSSSDTGACFLANLRLALIHGKKRNLKTARKHVKTALALIEGDSDSNTATVAAFVDNVLANAS